MSSIDLSAPAARTTAPAEAGASPYGADVAGLPIPIWGAFLSCLAMVLGWNWDISWHRSIGRDTVWTMAHVAIYIALLLAFAYNAWLVLAHTFGSLRKAPGIRILGFKGPSATFVTLWALLLQFVSIVFDNWWHNVYGLDVDVFSPPHGLLTWGLTVFYLGQFAVVALWRNTSGPEAEHKTRVLCILIWGLLLGHISIAPDPNYGPMAVRSIFFVASTSMAFPFTLVFLNSYLGRKSASALAALFWLAVGLFLMQLFQLFPATPQFGPVYHRIPHFLAPPFPMMLVVPAIAMGWILPPGHGKYGFAKYLAASVVFVATFTATNWLVSGFLMSPLAENRVFGYGGYPGQVFEEHYRAVSPLHADAAGALALGTAVVIGIFWAWFGDRGGRWLKEIVR